MTQKEGDFFTEFLNSELILNTFCHSGDYNKLIKKLIWVTVQEMRMTTAVPAFTILLLCCGINGTFLLNERDADLKDKTHLSGNILPLLYPMSECKTSLALH